MKNKLPIVLLALQFFTILSFAQNKLIDISNDYLSNFVKTKNAEVSISGSESLLIKMNPLSPLVELYAPNTKWDLSDNSSIAFEIKNWGNNTIMVNAFIGDKDWNEGVIVLDAGETKVLRILIKGYRLPKEHPLAKSYLGMFGLPGGYYWHWIPMDAKNVNKIRLSLVNAKEDVTFSIRNVVAEGNLMAKSYEELQQKAFPFVDQYGQYMHKKWSGKIHSDEELKEAIKTEENDLREHPFPQNRNKYGGWTKGKKLKATGHFRVEKLDGKWWFVDPEGCLFWSHGITGVAKGAAITKVEGRRHYFASIPDKKDPYYQFAKVNNKGKVLTYNYTASNLFRKYGDNWKQINSDMAHQRLKSWGMNTFGNWSDEETYLQRKTPYTVSVNFRWEKVGGKLKFPNVFDPNYRTKFEQVFKSHSKTWDDDFCIGYFVDNELHGWGTIGKYVFMSPATDNAKVELVKTLQSKYQTIQQLNTAWNTNFSSWEVLLKNQKEVQSKVARADLLQFEKVMVDLYYKTCRELIKAKAPNKLYMGSRLHNHYYPEVLSHQKWIVPIAAKYCDVISFNRYRFVPNDLIPHKKSIDKPIIIGEFHFGALDRGMLHTGLRSVQDQEQRGKVYIEYIKGALENPYIIGAHWFQYGEQAVTGRGDGENYQIGFLDVCDTPYQETIEASREIGSQMYEIRFGED